MTKNAFVIASVSSGSGKTTITLALIAALKALGYRVQPFKVGPDFIDPGLHSLVAERVSRNLDPWMCGSDYVRELFTGCLSDADVAVVEGVMGVLDGGESSSLNIARLLGIPVVLVLDVKSMAESAVLPVLGFKAVAADVRVAGLILNRVASKRHLELVEKSLRKHCDVELLGFIPLSRAIQMPQRHLGLFTAEDGILTRDFLNELTGLVKQNVDINRLMDSTEITLPSSRLDSTGRKERLCKIAVARDRAFCFYYQDNLDMLERQGAELVYFSPLKDRTLPEADALYIGGGYPELYAEELSKNQSMLEDVRAFSYSGRPVYAECGGFMYLSKGILVNQNERYPMAGVYPVWTRLKTKRASLGYREVMLNEDTIIGKKGSLIRGHEFHYSEIMEPTDSLHNVYKNAEGFFVKNTLSSYIHIHFASNPEIVRSLINSAIKHRY